MDDPLKRLKDGNRSYVEGLDKVLSIVTKVSILRVKLAEEGQKPFAIVLSCSDSRVPAEIIFDCGLGDLFVVRVAGNIVAPSLIGSIEFAAKNFGTSLCVVMGHTECGAVSATVEALQNKTAVESENIQKIVESIAPSVDLSHENVLKAATVSNVKHSIEQLSQSKILRELIGRGKLTLVGALYDLKTGRVNWFDS